MPWHELTVTPNTFSLPNSVGSTRSRLLTVRVPALPSAGCYWVRIRSELTLTVTDPGWFSLYSPNPALTRLPSLNDFSYGVVSRAGTVYQMYTEGAGSIPPIGGSFWDSINIDKLIARDVTLYIRHNNQLAATYTNLRIWLEYPGGCTPIDDPGPGGGDDDDDDDDIPNGPSSGLYRAVKVDQARGWLHVGNEAAVDTKHIVPGTAAFSSGSHGVRWWKQFDVDERSGTLFLLGRSTTAGFSKLFTSSDGGLSIEEVLNVECNSTVMKYDSQNKWLVVLTEAEPPTPSDPNSNGVVSMRISRNNGESFESPVTCEYLTGSLSARLLGMTYAEREGAELFLLCQIGAQKKLLSSTDGGKKWEARIA